MIINKFIYENKERNILVVQETDDDVFGYDLDQWSEEMKEKLKTTFRHFKKSKITNPPPIEEVVKKREA